MFNVTPEQQKFTCRTVKIGIWQYPVDEQGRALETCPECGMKLPPLGATPGHVHNVKWLSEQEHIELTRLQADAERLRKLTE